MPSVQGCTILLIGFVRFLNNLNLILEHLSIVFLFFYQTMPLRPMRNNVQHIYYFVSKKQKTFVKVFKKYLLYIL